MFFGISPCLAFLLDTAQARKEKKPGKRVVRILRSSIAAMVHSLRAVHWAKSTNAGALSLFSGFSDQLRKKGRQWFLLGRQDRHSGRDPFCFLFHLHHEKDSHDI